MVIYNNNKGFISGIPARNLSGEEWNALSPELQKLALESGVYEIKNDSKKSAVQTKENE